MPIVYAQTAFLTPHAVGRILQTTTLWIGPFSVMPMTPGALTPFSLATRHIPKMPQVLVGITVGRTTLRKIMGMLRGMVLSTVMTM